MIRSGCLDPVDVIALAHHNLRVARHMGAARNALQVEAWLDEHDPGWRHASRRTAR